MIMEGNIKHLVEKYRIKQPSYREVDLIELREMLEPVFQDEETKRLSDAVLKRFLKAFLTPKDAHNAIIHALQWREQYDVDNINPEDPVIIEEHSVGRCILSETRDIFGRPVVLNVIRNHSKHNRDLNNLTKYTVHMLEKSTSLCDENGFDNLCVVCDMQGFSYHNMDYSFVKRLIWLLQNCYPERLGVCLIVNAPWIFYGCWTIIKYWLNEVTTSKIIFIKTEEELSEFVDPENLPQKLF